MITLRKKKLKNGTISLYLDYNRTKNRYEFLKMYLHKNKKIDNEETMLLAENIRAKRQLNLMKVKEGFPVSSNISVIEFIENNKPSKKNYNSLLFHLKAFGDYPMTSIDEEWGNDFKDFLSRRVKHPNTIYTYISVLKSMFNLAVRKKILLSNPVKYVVAKKEDTEKKYLTFDELEKLAVTPIRDKEVARAFLFSCYTGMRISDVRKLEYNGETLLSFRQKKTKGMNYIPLSEMAYEILNMSTPGKAFKLVNNHDVLKRLQKWVDAAGIDKKITFHCSRHTFATLLISFGVDLYTVSKLLGHTTIKITEEYAKVVDKNKIIAVSKIPKIDFSSALHPEK